MDVSYICVVCSWRVYPAKAPKSLNLTETPFLSTFEGCCLVLFAAMPRAPDKNPVLQEIRKAFDQPSLRSPKPQALSSLVLSRELSILYSELASKAVTPPTLAQNCASVVGSLDSPKGSGFRARAACTA